MGITKSGTESDWKGRIQKIMKRERAEKQLMAPLWLQYPYIPDGSIGWRMGSGEYYAMQFYDWFESLTEEEQKEYDEKFPEPICWTWTESNIIEHNGYWNYKWNAENKPVYSKESIINEQKQGINREILYFWGHHSKENERTGKECFSQWYLGDFYVDAVKYNCMEQYMMSSKALLFGDEEINEKIMAAKNQKDIKSLGRKIKGFDEKIWNEFKRPIVLTGNYYKFSQLANFRNALLATGDSILVEASPYDQIWGIGMSAKEAKESKVEDWRGENLLGFALMEVRDELNRLRKFESEIDYSKGV